MSEARSAEAQDLQGRVRAILESSAQVKQATARDQAEAVARAAVRCIETFRAGHKVMLLGNGGSAADAQHIAAEWSGRLGRDRPALPALALTVNSSELTAIGNDYGFDRVFSRLVEAHGVAGDCLVAISTSGNSPNVLRAVDEARARGVHTIGLMGRGGGKLASRVDLPIVVPSEDTQRIQEAHITIGHVLAELVDDALFPEAAR